MQSKKSLRQLLYHILFIFAIGYCSPLVAQQYYLFAGTYTSGKSEGIYVYRFDAASGKITAVDTARNIENPSYLTVSGDGNYLYSVNENGGKEPGGISAFAFDKVQGKLRLLNQVKSQGDYPCYITVSKNRKWVIAGNYGSGSLVAVSTLPDGSLSDKFQLISDTGTGFDKERQEGPHVHSTVFSPDEKWLHSPDLGIDKIMAYSFNSEAPQDPLQAANPPYTSTTPGSGPRHLTFHKNGKWAYLIEEMSGQVSAYNYTRGKLQQMQRIDAQAAGYNGSIESADIHVSPDGKHLYASNRGEANNLAIYSIDQSTGKLKLVGFQDVLGKTPRNFVIEPGGKFVLVANQDTNDIRIFKRNSSTGLLSSTPEIIQVDRPVCLQFLRIN